MPRGGWRGRTGPGYGDSEQHQRRNRQRRRGRCCRPGDRRGDPGGELDGVAAAPPPGPWPRRPPGRSKRERGQDRERGHLDHAGDDACGGADLLEPEQPGPDRQQVAAEGGQREAGSGRGREPAGDDGPAAGGQHGQPEAEGGDHLQQEQPADRRDRPVAGQVQVQVDRPGGDQQAGTRYPQQDCPPARSRRSGVLLSGSRGPSSVPVWSSFPAVSSRQSVLSWCWFGLGWGAARLSTRSLRRRSPARNCLRARVLRCRRW